MAFFDFLNGPNGIVGSGPGQLSLAEILSTIPAVGGQYLMQRQGRIGGPLGAGLSAFGSLGETLAQRRQTQNQNQQMFQALQGINPSIAKYAPIVKAGGTIQDVIAASKASQTGLMKPFPISNGKTERMFDPATEGPDVPAGWYSSSFKPTNGGKPTLNTIYGPNGQTRKVAVDPNYVPPDGWSLNKPGTDKPPAPSWRTTVDSSGTPIQEAYRYNATTKQMEKIPVAGEDTSSGGLRTKPDATQQKQIDAVRNTQVEIPALMNTIGNLPNVSTAVLAREYAKYRAPFGALGPVDPRFSAYFSQIGQMKGDLLGAASGGRQSVPLMNYVKAHIPDETDPPARVLEKLKSFDVGRFNALLKNDLGTGTAAGAAATAAATPPPPAPPFEIEKTYNKDGQWYVSDKAGKFYKFDGTKWAPL